MFPNVCKHYLIIVYGCLKFTFKKVGRMLINYFQVLLVSVRFFCETHKISLSQIFRILLLSQNNDSSVHWATGDYLQLGDLLWLNLRNMMNKWLIIIRSCVRNLDLLVHSVHWWSCFRVTSLEQLSVAEFSGIISKAKGLWKHP